MAPKELGMAPKEAGMPAVDISPAELRAEIICSRQGTESSKLTSENISDSELKLMSLKYSSIDSLVVPLGSLNSLVTAVVGSEGTGFECTEAAVCRVGTGFWCAADDGCLGGETGLWLRSPSKTGL